MADRRRKADSAWLVKSKNTHELKRPKVKQIFSFHLEQCCYKAPHLSEAIPYITAILW